MAGANTIKQTPADQSGGRLKALLARPAAWFVVALVVRLLYLLEQGGTSPLFYVPLLDEKEALDSARQVLSGQVPAEAYFKAPGYSWLLAAVLAVSGEAWPWTVRLVQHVAGATLAWLVARMAGMVTPAGKSRTRATIIGGALTALYAPLIRLESNLSLDFWVVFLQSWMLLPLMKFAVKPGRCRKHLLCAGLWAAAAWITRPSITLVLPLMAVWIAVVAARRQAGGPRWRGAAVGAGIFVLPVALTMTAVCARNSVVGGEAIVMPWQGGFSLYEANRPGATGRYFLQSRVAEGAHANPARYLAVQGYAESLGAEARADFDARPRYKPVDEFWFRKTVDAVKAEPQAWLGLMTRKAVWLFSDKEIFNYEDYDLQKSLSGILPLMPGRFGVALPLALAGLAALGMISARRRQLHALLWVYALPFGGTVVLYFVSGRMRMPIAVPLLVLAGWGGAALLQPMGGARRAGQLAVLVAGVVLAWGDWWGVRSETMAHADLARMSNAAWHRQQYEQALEFALEAERRAPDYPALPRLKAQALYSLGQVEQAAVEFEKSVRVLGDETSRRNLLVIREELEKR